MRVTNPILIKITMAATGLITRKIFQKALLIICFSTLSSPLLSYDAELNALLFENNELMQSGQVAEALLLLKKNESIYGESQEYMNNLAVAYLSNSNPDLALAILRQLVDNDPLYSIITHNLLEIELQISDAREDNIKPVLFIQTVESFFNEELATLQENTTIDSSTPSELKVTSTEQEQVITTTTHTSTNTHNGLLVPTVKISPNGS